MALDGALLSCLREELTARLPDARVDKIHQPSREELIVSLRHRGGTEKLYLSARANSPRVHFTDITLENPASPPMFCMLLRKRLTGGRLTEIRQEGLERALYFTFECLNELGDRVLLTLAVEIMGRHSNIILIDQEGWWWSHQTGGCGNVLRAAGVARPSVFPATGGGRAFGSVPQRTRWIFARTEPRKKRTVVQGAAFDGTRPVSIDLPGGVPLCLPRPGYGGT